MSHTPEQSLPNYILIERVKDRITEVREKSPSRVQNLLIDSKLILVGLGARLHLKALPLELRYSSHSVIFADFKASPKPEIPAPECRACRTSLEWRPGPYSFGQNGNLFVVPEIGWWKCSSRHTGRINEDDLNRYAKMISWYENHVQDI